MKKRRNYHSRVQGRGRRGKGEEGFLLVTLTQAGLCTFMIVAAFVLTGFLGLDGLKPTISAMLQEKTSAKEVMAQLGSVIDPSSLDGVKEFTQSVFGRIAAIKDKQAEPQGADQGIVLPPKDEEAPGEEAGSKPGETKPLGMGGYNPVTSDEASPGGQWLKAPENAILAPVILSSQVRLPLSDYTVSCPFGYRIHPITGELDFHTGVDLAAPMGSEITAALPGKVVEVGEDRIYGNYIILDHGNGIQTSYNHCEKIIAPVGAVLRQGDRIATVGSTGVSTGPHCHFGLTVNGKMVDPMSVLSRWKGL